jgi:hypothetical protein
MEKRHQKLRIVARPGFANAPRAGLSHRFTQIFTDEKHGWCCYIGDGLMFARKSATLVTSLDTKHLVGNIWFLAVFGGME